MIKAACILLDPIHSSKLDLPMVQHIVPWVGASDVPKSALVRFESALGDRLKTVTRELPDTFTTVVVCTKFKLVQQNYYAMPDPKRDELSKEDG